MPGVWVVGNALVDSRLTLPWLPRPGESLLGEGGRPAPGGKGLNQAVAASRAGAQVRFCGPVGDDAEAASLRVWLAPEGFAQLHLPAGPHPTDTTLMLVLPDGENANVGTAACALAFPPEDAAAFVAGCGPGDMVLVQGNLTAAATCAVLRASEARTIFNPAPLQWDAAPLLPFCHIVVANLGEALGITGHADPAQAAMALRGLGARIAIVTAGADGCYIVDDTGCHVPAPVVRAVDTSGCGDVFCGVLAASLASGAALAPAIDRAQHAAARAATRPGAYAAIPTAAEIRPAPPASPPR